MVVLPDADIDQAADAAVSAAFGSAGQRCMAVSIAVAVGGVGDALTAAIAERVAKLRVGPASDPESEMGPVITAERPRAGAGIRRPWEQPPEPRSWSTAAVSSIAGHQRGNFVGPTVIDHVRPGMDVYDQEVFGPLLGIVRARDAQRGACN